MGWASNQALRYSFTLGFRFSVILVAKLISLVCISLRLLELFEESVRSGLRMSAFSRRVLANKMRRRLERKKGSVGRISRVSFQ